MKYIVYCTINTKNFKIYVGVHQTDNPNVFDGYLGNGVFINRPASYTKTTTLFKKAVKKYGINTFKRVTLRVCDTKEEAYLLEKLIVDEKFIKSTWNYNLKLGGEGGGPESNKVKVYMYDVSGNFIREFNSATECNKFINPTATGVGHVSRAIKKGHLFHGYQLSYEKTDCMKPYVFKVGSTLYTKAVGRYDDAGNLLESWETTKACFNAGYKNLSRALKQGIKCKGFYFKYLNKD